LKVTCYDTSLGFLNRNAQPPKGGTLRLRDVYVDQRKIVPLAQQRRVHCLCQRVGEAIAIVQRRTMPGTFAVSQVCEARRLRLP